MWEANQSAVALKTAVAAAATPDAPAAVRTAAGSVTALIDSIAPTFRSVSGTLVRQLMLQANADLAPAAAATRAFGGACRDLRRVTAAWRRAIAGLSPINTLLAKAALGVVPVPSGALAGNPCP